MAKFLDFQKEMWNSLTWFGVHRFYLDKNKDGSFVIKGVGKLRLLFFYSNFVNAAIKVLYLFFTYQGWLGIKVGFLDQMSIWNWFLMALQWFLETRIWMFQYPFYEILRALWNLQERIYKKLRSPLRTAENISKSDHINTFLYSSVVIVGTLAFLFQFWWTPKYATFTYAIFPGENFLLTTIFAVHEVAFMLLCYVHQAMTLVLEMTEAVTFYHLLQEMNEALTNLKNNRKNRKWSKAHKEIKKESENPSKMKTTKRGEHSEVDFLDPEAKADGTDYNIQSLIQEFKNMAFAMNMYNSCVGKKAGFIFMVHYSQFVADVFMMIQLLREPETDFMGIFFYLMDASFGVMMIFRMLILMCHLVPESKKFISGLKDYCKEKTPLRKYIVKTIPSLRGFGAKLSGHTVAPQSVPQLVHVLITWYINAALWHRPDDPSRRT